MDILQPAFHLEITLAKTGPASNSAFLEPEEELLTLTDSWLRVCWKRRFGGNRQLDMLALMYGTGPKQWLELISSS